MPAPDAGLTAAQLGNARAIIAAGRSRGASGLQIRIALMTALTESNLLNYANANNPDSLARSHDAVGRDHASVGVFQQQVGIWGGTAELMDINTSAGKFFDALKAAGTPNAAAPWLTAQKVQRSAFSDGSNYRKNWELAGSLQSSLDSGGTVPAGWLDNPVVTATGSGVAGALAGAARIGATLQSPEFWRRAGLFLLGAVLLLIVAWKILGGSKLAGAAVRVASKGVL